VDEVNAERDRAPLVQEMRSAEEEQEEE